MGAKILIVDDDTAFLDVLAELLLSQNYDIMKAYEGIEAVEMAQKKRPDCMILDWQMPSGKGSAVLQMIQEKSETAQIPVIVLSGAQEAGMEDIMKQFHVKKWIQKPYKADELLEALRKIL